MPITLNNTAVVILGLLASGPKSGYDIKHIVDRSTRFFWRASYGQIYPELRRLEANGLVRGHAKSRGDRARTEYELTRAGRAALRDWLTSSGELTHEIRDEGLLRFFFSDELEPEEQMANLRAMRERYERLAVRLREEIEPFAADAPGEFPLLTARFGIELYESLSAWCERMEAELETSLG